MEYEKAEFAATLFNIGQMATAYLLSDPKRMEAFHQWIVNHPNITVNEDAGEIFSVEELTKDVELARDSFHQAGRNAQRIMEVSITAAALLHDIIREAMEEKDAYVSGNDFPPPDLN